jgi:hypothetical protein
MTHLPTFLLSKELAAQLRLQEQHFVVLIPKKLIPLNELSFELSIVNNRISLLGPKTNQVPEVNQSDKVIDT